MTKFQNMYEDNTATSSGKSNPSIFKLFACKCPRCRKGDMFEHKNPWHLKNTLKMHRECPVCAQPLDIEVGFYFGSGYVSYAFAVAFSVATFGAWWLLVGFSLYDDRVLYWLTLNATLLVLLQPYFMRLARTVWLAFFVHYDRSWRTNRPQPLERINKGQQNNW